MGEVGSASLHGNPPDCAMPCHAKDNPYAATLDVDSLIASVMSAATRVEKQRMMRTVEAQARWMFGGGTRGEGGGRGEDGGGRTSGQRQEWKREDLEDDFIDGVIAASAIGLKVAQGK